VKTCGVCLGTYRGAGGRVYVSSSGRFEAVRACPDCKRGAIRLAPSVVRAACACGGEATVCDGCARARADRSDGVARALNELQGRLRGYRAAALPGVDASFAAGLIAGLESAIATLRAFSGDRS